MTYEEKIDTSFFFINEQSTNCCTGPALQKMEFHALKLSEFDSSEVAFKIAGSLATRDLKDQGGAVLLEPMMKVEVVTPEANMGDVVGDLNRRRGMILGMSDTPMGKVIDAEVPLAEMFGYATDLRSATQGRATFAMEFDQYVEAPNNVAREIMAKNGMI